MVAQVLLLAASAILIVDIVLLFNPSLKISGRRNVQQILSLGDENKMSVELENISVLSLHIKLIDELPEQFQRRDFAFQFKIYAKEKRKSTIHSGLLHVAAISLAISIYF